MCGGDSVQASFRGARWGWWLKVQVVYIQPLLLERAIPHAHRNTHARTHARTHTHRPLRSVLEILTSNGSGSGSILELYWIVSTLYSFAAQMSLRNDRWCLNLLPIRWCNVVYDRDDGNNADDSSTNNKDHAVSAACLWWAHSSVDDWAATESTIGSEPSMSRHRRSELPEGRTTLHTLSTTIFIISVVGIGWCGCVHAAISVPDRFVVFGIWWREQANAAIARCLYKPESGGKGTAGGKIPHVTDGDGGGSSGIEPEALVSWKGLNVHCFGQAYSV